MPLLNRHLPCLGNRQQGFTLIELVVVIAILAVVAGLILVQLGTFQFAGAGQNQTSEQIATVATLGAVRDAILGTSGHPGLWQDLGERTNLYPLYIADLFRPSTNLPSALQSFNPVTRLGWRGPYLTPGGALYTIINNFTTSYGANGDPAVADAWGRPIVLQIPTSGGWQYARLVSAGPNGVLDTPITVQSPSGNVKPPSDNSDRKDDLILFLFVADTNVATNTSGP